MANLKKSQMFEYIALWHPNEDEAKTGSKSKIIVEKKSVLCADEKGAFMLACKEVPEAYTSQTDQVEILVRPF